MKQTQSKTKRGKFSKYAGEWVAFVKEKIVAHDKNLSKTMDAVKKKGLENKSSVFLVPRKNEGPYVLLT